MKRIGYAAFALIKTTFREVGEDDLPSLSAALAYYTVFSLPPLLVILVAVAGLIAGPEAVREALLGQVGGLVGAQGATAIETMIEEASDLGASPWTKVVGFLTLLLGATGAFGALQKAINRAWAVEPEQASGLRARLFKRVLSFGMVLTLAFFLLVSLAISTALAMLSEGLGSALPLGIPAVIWQLVNLVVSVGVTAGLFAVLFKTLPDAEIAWRDVGIGALATAVLFTLGKWGLGFYLGRSDPGSAFGAAGTLALILVWIYYTALIVLVGAEFTQVYANRYGSHIRPDDDATERPG
ncbi:MAG: YihY/virulence factor BrkB family protein [Rhodothermaceae bacterium]|nr:YihY/virulence factor BrkB family protein [Rhodothermaceae bacterium]